MFLVVSAAGAKAQTSDYKLAPSDIVGVEVFQEPTLTTEIQVSATGEITYPLLGQLKVGGKTPAEVQDMIRDLLAADYLVNPSVIIKVINYRQRKVSVSGAVLQPRPVELPAEQEMTILEAITQAGGFSRTAKKSEIRLLRRGEPERVFNEKQLIKQLEGEDIFFLKPDDIIIVAESFL